MIELGPSLGGSSLLSCLAACLSAAGRPRAPAVLAGFVGHPFETSYALQGGELWSCCALEWSHFGWENRLGFRHEIFDIIGNKPELRPKPTAQEHKQVLDAAFEAIARSTEMPVDSEHPQTNSAASTPRNGSMPPSSSSPTPITMRPKACATRSALRAWASEVEAGSRSPARSQFWGNARTHAAEFCRFAVNSLPAHRGPLEAAATAFSAQADAFRALNSGKLEAALINKTVQLQEEALSLLRSLS